MTRFSSLVRGEAKENRSKLAQSMIDARLHAGLKQKELADLMGTSRSTITRMESGRELPTVLTLEKWAELTGKKLQIKLI